MTSLAVVGGLLCSGYLPKYVAGLAFFRAVGRMAGRVEMQPATDDECPARGAGLSRVTHGTLCYPPPLLSRCWGICIRLIVCRNVGSKGGGRELLARLGCLLCVPFPPAPPPPPPPCLGQFSTGIHPFEALRRRSGSPPARRVASASRFLITPPRHSTTLFHHPAFRHPSFPVASHNSMFSSSLTGLRHFRGEGGEGQLGGGGGADGGGKGRHTGQHRPHLAVRRHHHHHHCHCRHHPFRTIVPPASPLLPPSADPLLGLGCQGGGGADRLTD